eukprot:CAMPEP_0114244900 /NCGR_PEP_ID=MMETSP0058-20121206/11595_1 /TAXON_ID=36894 /ORGANISM="Pyramimonas parkeae, CCMP726" /LENGTH=35 /DNA_ID= /DNA_START= /DNA_END= /DNA_ORIENTATION=
MANNSQSPAEAQISHTHLEPSPPPQLQQGGGILDV